MKEGISTSCTHICCAESCQLSVVVVASSIPALLLLRAIKKVPMIDAPLMRPMWLFLILTKGGQSSHMPPDGWGNILVSNISTPSNLEKLLVWYELSSKFMHDSVRLAIVLYPTIWPFKKISEKFSYSQSNLPKWHTIYLVGHHSKHHNQTQSRQMYRNINMQWMIGKALEPLAPP